MRKLVLFAMAMVAAAPAALADECRSNDFQPTFVRHDASQQAWYVETSGKFTAMISPAGAQDTCKARGVRMSIRGQTCAQRSWGDFGCGCNIMPAPNTTCAGFHAHLRSIGVLK